MGQSDRTDRKAGIQFFGKGGFGRDNSRRREQRGPRQMYKAVCANCGKECEVPFRPTDSKPVYCNDCFAKMGGGRREEKRFGNGDRRNNFNRGREMGRGGSDPQTLQLLQSINTKLDKLLSKLDQKASQPEVNQEQKTVSRDNNAPKTKDVKTEIKESGVIMENPELKKAEVNTNSAEKKESTTKKTAAKKTSKKKVE